MDRMRRAVALLMVLALSGIAIGCGSSTSPEMQKTLTQLPDVIAGLNLPSVPIPVTIGDDGRITNIGGFDAAVVDNFAESIFGGKILGSLAVLNKDQVDWLKRSNIQHVTLALRPKGAFALVNGKALPYVDWQNAGDEDVLKNLVDFLGRMQYEKGTGKAYLLTPENYQAIKALLPLAKSVGLRLDVQLPRDPANEPIPLGGNEAFDLALTNAEIEDKPTNAASVDLSYKELPDGTWVPALLGLSTADLQTVARPLGLRIPSWRLRKDIQKRFDADAFKSLGFETRADGVFVTVDGKLLPHLAWSNATLTNLAQTLNQLYPPGTPLPSDAAYVPVLRTVAPMLNDLSLVGVVHFPADKPQ